jgi:hypothetical protein
MAQSAPGDSEMNSSSARTATELDALGIVSVLNGHGVRYVIIGAFAAIAQQAPIAPTRDIDLTPEDSPDNLRKLSRALKELDARVRTDSASGGIPFGHDAASLGRAATWNLICSYGEFDISFRPSGFEGGYRELAVRAHRLLVDGVEVSVADLDDVIRSKEAAGRPKDLQVLPALYRHRDNR